MNEVVEKKVIKKYLLVVIAVFSVCALSTSYLVQYVWKIEPCYLCKLQRMPYLFLSFVPLLGFTSVPFKAVKISILLLFSLLFILSSYHLMVIGGFIKDFCAIHQPIGNMQDFMKMLENHVPCSKVSWKLLGIPVAGYNCLFSIFFVFFFGQRFSFTKERIKIE